MSTHSICLYGELENIILELSSNTPSGYVPLARNFPICRDLILDGNGFSQIV